jgi:hypothetical protein
MHTLGPILIYWLNGLLAALYWLVDHWPAGASLACALAIARWIERPHVTPTLAAPGRYGRAPRVPRRQRWAALQPHLGTLGLAAAWTLVALTTPAPVPVIGLAMWLAALLAPLSLPFAQRPVVHRLRWFIGAYTALVAAFRLLARHPLSPAQAAAWSNQLRSVGAGEALDQALRSQFLPYLALVIWGVLPLTYFGWVVQHLGVQRHLLRAPWRALPRRLADLRTREPR